MAEFSQAFEEEVVQGQIFSLPKVDFTAIEPTDEMIRIFRQVVFHTLLAGKIRTASDAASNMNTKY